MRAPAARAALIVPLLLCCTAVAAGVVSQLAHPDDFYERDPAGFDYLLERGSRNTLPVGKASRDAGVAADTVEPTLILLMANSNYKEVLFNFIWILETRYSALNYGIACMDNEIREYLAERKIQCYPMLRKNAISGLEKRTVRMELILNLLRAGVNVIQNDVDAVWRADLRLDLQEADITGQRDKHPAQLIKSWGSTFCTGSLFLRSCGKTVSYLEGLLDNTQMHAFLDQLRFNMGLQHKTRGGVTWISPIDSRFYGSKDSTGDVSRGVCKGWDDMTLALLPQDPYRRECTGNRHHMRTAKIIHCNRDKKGAEKEDMLRGHEAWELPERFADCMQANWKDNLFSRRCAAGMQRTHEAIHVDWCREFVEDMKMRPLTRGSHYEGPLFGEDPSTQRYDSPWGKADNNPRVQRLFHHLGLGEDRGCEAIIGKMGDMTVAAQGD